MVIEVFNLETAQLTAAKTSIEGKEEHDVHATLPIPGEIKGIEEGFHSLYGGNVHALSRHGALDVLHGRIIEDSLFNQEPAEDLQYLYPGEP